MEKLQESDEFIDFLDANRQFRKSLRGFDVVSKPVVKPIILRKRDSVRVTISRDLHLSLKSLKGRKSFNDFIASMIKSRDDAKAIKPRVVLNPN